MSSAARRTEGAALLLLLLAALLRIWNIQGDGLWVDEAYTALISHGSLSHIFSALKSDDAPPFFYILEKGVLSLTGRSEAGMRVLPLAAGIAAVALAWAVARRFTPGSERFALIAFGFSSLAAFYARQARSYSLLDLFTLALLYFTLALRRGVTARRTAGFAASALALLYTHNLGVLVLLAAAALVVRRFLATAESRRLALAGGLILLVLAMPWAWQAFHQLGVHEVSNAWIRRWWQAHSLALAPIYSFAAFTNGVGPWLFPPTPLPGFARNLGWLRWILLGVTAAGFLRALQLLLRRRAKEPAGDARAALLSYFLFALVPLIGLLAVSLAVGPAYIVGRTDHIALPGFLLALAFGWARLPRGWMRRGVAGLWILSAVFSLYPVWSGAPGIGKGSDRDLAALLGREVRAGDALVLTGLSRPSLEYYGTRQGWWQRLQWKGSFPPMLDANPSAATPTPLDSVEVYERQSRSLRQEWEKAGIRRVWIVALCDPETRDPQGRWPQRPAPPAPDWRTADANAVGYPMSLMVGALAGLHPVPVIWQYRQDWLGGARFVLRVERERWVPVDSLPRVEVQP